MVSGSGSEAPGRSLALRLKREGWAGRASFAWVRSDCFPALALDYRRFLHPEEIRYYEGLSFEKRRLSYLLGRFAAKQAIRHYADLDACDTQVRILPGVFNQPVVRFDVALRLADPIGISISHTDSIACSLAFPEAHPMGVDLEAVDDQKIEIMKTQILDEERALASPHCTDEGLICTTIWTAKEALSKILRCGMMCPYELLAIGDFNCEAPGFSGVFRNFSQYKFVSWCRNRTVVTFVLPRRTSVTADYPDCL